MGKIRRCGKSGREKAFFFCTKALSSSFREALRRLEMFREDINQREEKSKTQEKLKLKEDFAICGLQKEKLFLFPFFHSVEFFSSLFPLL